MRALLVAMALCVAACDQGNGLDAPDLQAPDDLAEVDLLPEPDLLPGPSCGQIVFCALQCGTQNLTCVLGCGQNADPQQVGAALALVACAAQNCLSVDGGQLQIFQCLGEHCRTQLMNCEGLGGFGF
jgi:hypothetical protein